MKAFIKAFIFFVLFFYSAHSQVFECKTHNDSINIFCTECNAGFSLENTTSCVEQYALNMECGRSQFKIYNSYL